MHSESVDFIFASSRPRVTLVAAERPTYMLGLTDCISYVGASMYIQ